MKSVTIAAAGAALLALTAALLYRPVGAQQPVAEIAPTLEECFKQFVTAAQSEHGAKLGETYCQRRFVREYAELMQ